MKYNRRYGYKNKISLFLKIVRMFYKLIRFSRFITDYSGGSRKMSSYRQKLGEEYKLHYLGYTTKSIIILHYMLWWIIVIELDVKHYLYMYKDSYKIIKKNKNVYYNKFYYYFVVIEKVLKAGRGLVKYLQRCNYDIIVFRKVKWRLADVLKPIWVEMELRIYNKVCGLVGVSDGLNSSMGFRNDMLKSFFKRYVNCNNKRISDEFIFSGTIGSSELFELKLRYKNIIMCRKRRWCYYYLIVTQYAEYVEQWVGIGSMLMRRNGILIMRYIKKQVNLSIYRKLYKNYIYYLIHGYRDILGRLSEYGNRKKIIHNNGKYV